MRQTDRHTWRGNKLIFGSVPNAIGTLRNVCHCSYNKARDYVELLKDEGSTACLDVTK